MPPLGKRETSPGAATVPVGRQQPPSTAGRRGGRCLHHQLPTPPPYRAGTVPKYISPVHAPDRVLEGLLSRERDGPGRCHGPCGSVGAAWHRGVRHRSLVVP